MTRKHGRPFAALETRLSAAIRGAGIGAKAVADAVADPLSAVLTNLDPVATLPPEMLSAAADAAVRAAARAHGDLGYVARGFMLGALRASGRTGERAQELGARAARAFVERAREAGVDATAAGRGLVEGSVAWAAELDGDIEKAAAAAAQAAVDAAYDAGPLCGEKMLDALKSGVAGLALVLKMPIYSHRT